MLGNITAVREAKDLIECSFQCIEFGPVPCLSFSLEKTNRNVRICELIKQHGEIPGATKDSRKSRIRLLRNGISG